MQSMLRLKQREGADDRNLLIRAQKNMDWQHAFQRQVEELGRKIESIRAQVSQRHTPLEVKASVEFAEIDARHADLQHTVQNLQSRDHRPRQEVVDALEADFRGLMQSIDRWIERQDVNASTNTKRTETA